MNIITGEKIQKKCDYYLGDIRQLKNNSYLDNNNDKWIILDNYNLNDIKKLKMNKLFCYTDVLIHKTDELINILKNISCYFDLYFHNSDYSFNKEHLKLFEIDKIKKIYTQNLNTSLVSNLYVLPIGIANSRWRHGNLNLLTEIIEENNEKSSNFFFNFKIATNRKKRQLCYDEFKDKINYVSSTNNQVDYLRNLSRHKYCICPEGNGLDTHRFWECLYLKVIPICLKNVITEYYSNYVPIILLDNWHDLDIENIDNVKTKVDTWEGYDSILNINYYI